MENNYVISVKRIKNYNGELLKPEEQEFKYFQYDRYAGSHSTGYPCFGYLCHAEKFESVEKAIETFNNNFEALKLTENVNKLDLSTLAVRKITFHKKADLQWGYNNGINK